MNDQPDNHEPSSPAWTSTTKTVIGLSLAALVISLLVSFRAFLGPVLVSGIISYLFYPWAIRIQRFSRLPWRVTVGVMYLLTLLVLFGLITWGGITVIEQIQNLIKLLQTAINDLPNTIAYLTATPQQIGPFKIDLRQLDLATSINQALGIIQPLLSQAGTLVGTLASSAANIVGWTIFSLLLSYFTVSETHSNPKWLSNLPLSKYHQDFRRMRQELIIIWNAFLRGQVILFSITASIYICTMGILGVRYYFGLAMLAGLARFVPYVGPIVSWSVNALVAYSQGYALFNLPPDQFTILVLAVVWISDAIIENLISPRIFSNALRIHPAAVMVTALLGFNLIGIVGVVLAAPVLATAKLAFDYVLRKLLDVDPWIDFDRAPPPTPITDLLWRIVNGLLKQAHAVAGRFQSIMTKIRKQVSQR
jgi:predicted PurR-regulated permease PerM